MRQNILHCFSKTFGLFVLSGAILSFNIFSGCTARVHTQPGALPEAAPAPSHKEELIQAKPEWFSCQEQGDCQVEKGLCGMYSAVNKDYLEPFHAFRDKMTPTLDCKPQEEPTNRPTASCVQNRCSINEADAE